jgi:hypothetical protein
MKTGILLVLTVVITSSAIFSGIMFTAPSMFQAYAVGSLDPDNAANSIIVHTNRQGQVEVRTYDSFSRIGFVSGMDNFLLESVPSLDKKEFYEYIKDSLDNKNQLNQEQINFKIDIYSGSDKLIETLEYNKCELNEYFVHAIDSLGKIQFIERENAIEIREVIKFECLGFTINLDRFGTSLQEQFDYEEAPVNQPEEGDLRYNTGTNILQKYQNGEWINISGKGGTSIQK